MGGALILSAITISTLLWADLSNRYVWGRDDRDPAVRGYWLGRRLSQVIGFQRGLPEAAGSISGSRCLVWAQQSFCSMTAPSAVETADSAYPQGRQHPLGIGFVVLTYFVIVGSSNAVSLTRASTKPVVNASTASRIATRRWRA